MYSTFDNRGRIFRRTLTSGLLLLAGGFFVASGAAMADGAGGTGTVTHDGTVINPASGSCDPAEAGIAIVGDCTTTDNTSVKGSLSLGTDIDGSGAEFSMLAGAVASGDKTNVKNSLLNFSQTEVAVPGHVEAYGGYSANGGARGNDVVFSSANVSTTAGHSMKVVGGHSDSGNKVSENKIQAGGSTVSAGGTLKIIGGESAGTVRNNKVVLTKADAAGHDGIRIVGGASKTVASANVVNIRTESDITGAADSQANWIVGGKVTGSNNSETLTAGDANATGPVLKEGNTVSVLAVGADAPTFSEGFNIAGGWIAGASAQNATVHADNNTVILNGGNYAANTNIYGGLNTFADVADGAKVTASYNTVELKNGSFSPNTRIVGGETPQGGEANNNKVVIFDGDYQGLSNVTLIGGWTGGTGETSNNALYVKTAGLTVNDIKGFQQYDFTIDNTVANGDVMMTTKSDWTLHGDDSVNVSFQGAQQEQFKVGDQVGLIEVADGATFTDEGWDNQHATVAQGPFLSAEGTVSTDNDGLLLTFKAPGTDNGNTDNGGTDNGNTDNGGTDNGGTDNGNTDNGGTDNGNTDNGGTDNGGSDNGDAGADGGQGPDNGDSDSGSDNGGDTGNGNQGSDNGDQDSDNGGSDGADDVEQDSDNSDNSQSDSDANEGTDTPDVPDTDGSGHGDIATTVDEESKAPVEGRVSVTTMMAQATAMTTQGVARAMAATANVPNASFGATSGGSLRLNSGSHVNLDSVGVMLGAAHRMGGNMVGGYFEFGYGSYTTHNNFSGNNVEGSGHNRYIGAGVLGRHDWQDADGEGAYVSGGVHAGNVKSSWASSDLGVSYDTSGAYYGAQAKGGYVLNLSDRVDLDMYGQYAWTHVASDEATMAGTPFKFDSVDSQQVEIGTQVNYDVTKQLSGYAGLAWSHEFDGKAEATIFGQSTPTPSVKGSTGKLTAGVAYEPEGVTGLSFNVGLTGYTGKTEGVTGSLGAKFVF